MNPDNQFYIYRVWYDAKQKRSRFRFLTERGGWTNNLSKAQSFPDRVSAQTTQRGRAGAILDIVGSSYYP